MDISIRDVTQVSLDQVLAYQQAVQKDNSAAAANTAGLASDEASVIQKAGELAREILRTEESRKTVLDWNEIDTPENAYQAAKSILKYGV